MGITSDFIATSFIKKARNKFLDTYLVKRGDKISGEIFLKLNKLNGYCKIYTYKKSSVNNPWKSYGLSDWEEEKKIKKKLDRVLNIDPDVWIIEIDDKLGNSPNFLI